MAWQTAREFLDVVGLRKLSELTTEEEQVERVGVGDGAKTTFDLPFFGGAVAPFLDGAEQTVGFTIGRETGPGGRDRVTFGVAPGVGVVVGARSADAVNADVYEAAALRAQGLIRGMVEAGGYACPADDATTVPTLVLSWFQAITAYLLCTDPRRPRLLEAYPEVARRYDDVLGGVDSDLKRVGKRTMSLVGVLPPKVLDAAMAPASIAYVGDEPVFTAANARGF